MARFRSPITGRIVSFAAAARWDYDDEITGLSAKEISAGRTAQVEEPVEEFTDFDDELFFDQAEQLEEFEFDELADLDIPWDEFIDDIGEDFDDIEETDYEDTQA